MIGNKLTGGKQKLTALQTDFHAAVASKFELSKAPARLAGTVKQTGAKAVLQKLQAMSDGALQRAAWAVTREAVERDPGLFLLVLGIELATLEKKLRTSTAIFTSKEKGKAKEISAVAFSPLKKTNVYGL